MHVAVLATDRTHLATAPCRAELCVVVVAGEVAGLAAAAAMTLRDRWKML
jgi:hypothetical protein